MGKLWLAQLKVDDIEVNGTDTAWTRSFDFNGNPNGESSIEVKFDTTAGSINVRLELELSNEKLTEAEQYLANDNYVIGDRDTPVATVTNEDVTIIGFNSIPTLYGRIKMTGLAGNAADTKLVTGRKVEAA